MKTVSKERSPRMRCGALTHRRLAGVTRGLCILAGFTLAGCESKSACVANGVEVEIAGNHKHAMSIPTDHIERAVGGMYPVKGAADHEHVVKLSDADMEQLKAGESVQTRSTSVQSHTHEIAIRCKQ